MHSRQQKTGQHCHAYVAEGTRGEREKTDRAPAATEYVTL